MKISLVVTVLNEEKTIDPFLDSVAGQTVKPDEVIVVDGGSVDWTLQKLAEREEKIRVIVKEGANRAVGRNMGVEKAKNEIIAFTDAGCVLDKNWLKEIIKPFKDTGVEVVAGYYQAQAYTVFEKCSAPFALVMPDKVNPKKFLPASRSMAIKKAIFWKNGGFPEDCPDNEDYVFAQILRENGVKIVFSRNAIVNWLPTKNLRSFWKMIFRFARGDAKAGLRRLKVLSVFFRYLFFLILLLLSLIFGEFRVLALFSVFLYFSFAIYKNFRYVSDLRAFYLLPLLQVTADLAVMAGSMAGFFKYV